MKQMDLHDKAIRLIEGGLVEVDGLVVRAIKVVGGFDVCNECDMDCLCKGEIAELCGEVYEIVDSDYILKLA